MRQSTVRRLSAHPGSYIVTLFCVCEMCLFPEGKWHTDVNGCHQNEQNVQ